MKLEIETLRVLLLCSDQKESKVLSEIILTPDVIEPREYKLDIISSLENDLALIKSKQHDILIYNLESDEQNAIETVNQIKVAAPQIPIIILTSTSQTSLARLLLEKGVQDYILKEDLNVQLLHKMIVFAFERDCLMKHGVLSEKRFKNLIDNNMDAMLVLDEENKIIFCNSTTGDLFGSDKDKLISKHFEYDFELDKITQIEIPQEDTEPVVGDIRASEIEWGDHNAKLVTIRDVTEFQKVEKLKQQIGEYERISKLKDQFLGAVSHELRTPLTIIRGAVGNMVDGIVGELTEQQNKVMSIANNNVTRLARIIDDLLDLSRLESEKVRINPRQIDLDSFIDNFVQSFQMIATKKNITLYKEQENEVPPLYADPDMLAQVMNNLISNAMRFAKSKITIKSQKINDPTLIKRLEVEDVKIQNPENKAREQKYDSKQSFVQISVIDDGEGIANDRIDDLFKKFVQLNRPMGGAGYKGTGLGLAICKAIIDQHQGKIWVESEVKKGSTFNILLSHYDESKIFYANLKDGIANAKINNAPLCILMIFVTNIVGLYENCNGDDIQDMFEGLQREIQTNFLHKSDKISFYPNKGLVMIQLQTDRRGGELLKEKIPELTNNLSCAGKKNNLHVQTVLGLSMFPEESTNPAVLLNLAHKNSQKRRVLIIDDEQSILDMIVLLLRAKEYQVETAVDGVSGLELALSFKPEVIVLDIMMPGLNGWEVCQRLSADPRTKNIKILILTASKDNETNDKAKLYNAQVMQKPYVPANLLLALKELSHNSENEFRF